MKQLEAEERKVAKEVKILKRMIKMRPKHPNREFIQCEAAKRFLQPANPVKKPIQAEKKPKQAERKPKQAEQKLKHAPKRDLVSLLSQPLMNQSVL